MENSTNTDNERLIEVAVTAAYNAGRKILEVYDTAFNVEHKEDRTPLTLADKKAHEVIVEHLDQTKIPILSEEGRSIEYNERATWKRFWMVDPLDGTKEFIKRNGEFTVNIALIENGISVSGVIYVPVTGDLYFAMFRKGAYKIEKFNNPIAGIDQWIDSAKKLPIQAENKAYSVVGSRSHKTPET